VEPLFLEAPYRTVLEAHPHLANPPDAGDRIALGFAIWFFLAGLGAVVWRPGWLGRSLVALSILPAAVSFAAQLAISSQAGLLAATQAWGVCAILALSLFGDRRRNVAKVPLQAGLTAAFGTWSSSPLASARRPPRNG